MVRLPFSLLPPIRGSACPNSSSCSRLSLYELTVCISADVSLRLRLAGSERLLCSSEARHAVELLAPDAADAVGACAGAA
jgi:hypothetical protein